MIFSSSNSFASVDNRELAADAPAQVSADGIEFVKRADSGVPFSGDAVAGL